MNARSYIAVILAVSVSAASSVAFGQAMPVSSPLRPMVIMQWPQQAPPGSAGTITAAQSAVTAIGIFDTGDPENTLSPETATLVNPGFLAAVGGGRVGGIPTTNTAFSVALGVNQTASGFLGATLAGPEGTVRVNQPAHTLTVTNFNQAAPLTAGQFRQITEYYNFRGSENHIGTPFVSLPTGAAGGATRLVVQIDPENQTTIPFAYDNLPTDRAGLTAGPSLPLDQQTTSVTFHAVTDPSVPTFPQSDDPGNVFRIPLTPINFNGGGAAAAFNSAQPNTGTNDTTSGADIAPRPGVTASGVNFIMDTGAPGTSVPAATWTALAGPITTVNGVQYKNMTINFPTVGTTPALSATIPVSSTTQTPLLGANFYNQYGQDWDFQNNQLVLTGQIKPNVLFVVDRTTQGLARTGVNQESLYGPSANGVDQASEIFRSGQTGSNATFIQQSGLSLQNNDHLNALSFGQDQISANIAFSVSRSTAGQNGTAVHQQFSNNQQAGDIYLSNTGNNTITPGPPQGLDFNRGAVNGANALYINQELLGLGVSLGINTPKATMGPNFNGGNNAQQEDQLGDFKLQAPRPIDPLQPAIFSPGQLSVDTFRVYFTLDTASPSRGTFSTADVLTNGLGLINKFADHTDLGLGAADAIDALELNDTLNPGTLDKGLANTDSNIYSLAGIDGANSDLALFSLAPGSPVLAADNLSAADLFISDFDGHFHLFATAESLGLEFGDNIVGLSPGPEPASLLLLGVGSLGLLKRRRGYVIA